MPGREASRRVEHASTVADGIGALTSVFVTVHKPEKDFTSATTGLR